MSTAIDARYDALAPPEMADKAELVGVRKAHMALENMFVLAGAAGLFVALGAVFATTVTAGMGDVPYGFAKALSGVAFSLGLVLVVVAGAELFTGNNLIVMAWANGEIGTGLVVRNWAIVYVGNFVGALLTVAIMLIAKQYLFGSGAVGLAALNIAEGKSDLGFTQAIALGVLCNALVCLAIWLSFSCRSVVDRILAIVFPITAFVAAGFEHCVANMYFIPMGLLIKLQAPDSFWVEIGRTPADYPNLTLGNFLAGNLLPVTIGNILGGSLLVGAVYWFVYHRTRSEKSQ